MNESCFSWIYCNSIFNIFDFFLQLQFIALNVALYHPSSSGLPPILALPTEHQYSNNSWTHDILINPPVDFCCSPLFFHCLISKFDIPSSGLRLSGNDFSDEEKRPLQKNASTSKKKMKGRRGWSRMGWKCPSCTRRENRECRGFRGSGWTGFSLQSQPTSQPALKCGS